MRYRFTAPTLSALLLGLGCSGSFGCSGSSGQTGAPGAPEAPPAGAGSEQPEPQLGAPDPGAAPAEPDEPEPMEPNPAKGEYDPCGGKACGAPCHVCPPDDSDCEETAVEKSCNQHGSCQPGMAQCPNGASGGYDPCAGKACGDACKVCPPTAADCVETAVLKACDASGQCRPAQPGTCPGGAGGARTQ